MQIIMIRDMRRGMHQFPQPVIQDIGFIFLVHQESCQEELCRYIIFLLKALENILDKKRCVQLLYHYFENEDDKTLT